MVVVTGCRAIAVTDLYILRGRVAERLGEASRIEIDFTRGCAVPQQSMASEVGVVNAVADLKVSTDAVSIGRIDADWVQVDDAAGGATPKQRVNIAAGRGPGAVTDLLGASR